MPAAAKCELEEHRLEALRRYDILDSPEEEAFDDITRLVSHICQTPIAVVNLIDRDRQFFKSEVGLGVRETPLDSSLCAHALLQPGLLVVPDTTEDARFSDNPLVTGAPGLRFYAGALLKTSDGHALGTMCVLDYRPRTLTEEQKDTLQIMARQVMSLIELRWRYAHERNIAETLQRAMLATAKPGQFPGLVIESLYEAARDEAEVGGDFFDSFALPSGKIALVVGDVAGKGLAAASRTAEVKVALRVYLRENLSPGAAVARLNRFLIDAQIAEERNRDVFVALNVVVLDPASGDLETVAAGAELALIARPDGTVEAIGQHDLPLGVAEDAFYHVQHAHLGPKECVIMLTDGITEARRGREFFGGEGIEQTLRDAAPFADDTSVARLILEAARSFARGNLRDDVCILVARRLPLAD